MKKRMMILFSLLMAVVLMPGIVNAEEVHYTNMNTNTNRTTNANVVVGNVAGGNVTGPVYSVDMYWNDFVFDWVYNSQSNQYEWGNDTEACQNFVIHSGDSHTVNTSNGDKIYYDSSCKNSAPNGTVLTSGSYYQMAPRYHDVLIYDYSENGYVQPSLSWHSSSNYSFTTASFKYEANKCEAVSASQAQSLTSGEHGWYLWTNSDCSGEPTLVTSNTYVSTNSYYGQPDGSNHTEYKLISGGSIPAAGRLGDSGWAYGYGNYSTGAYYKITLELGVDRTQAVRTPVKNETIGSLTVTLTARRN